MVKKTRKAAALAAGLLAALLLAAPAAHAAEAPEAEDAADRIEQVQTELPRVQAWFYAPAAGDAPEVGGTLGRTELTVESVRRYDATAYGTHYLFLVDCSTSTTAGQMGAVKAALKDFAENRLAANDTMTLITFGVAVQTPVKRENDPAKITAAVESLAADQPGTVFFDALAEAIRLADNKDFAMDREVAFVFSDSVDYNLGGYTKDEIDKMLAATGVPFYALGFNTGSKEQLDNFGAVARTSGGKIAIVGADTVGAQLAAMHDEICTAFVAELAAPNNVIENERTVFNLNVYAAGADKPSVLECEVLLRNWVPDTTAPTVAAVSQDTPESIRLTFSEPVQGAESAESYAVKDAAGDLLGIRAAAYDEAALAVQLTFATPPPSGPLSIECPGVTDISMEQNKVAGAASLQFAGTDAVSSAPPPAPEGDVPALAWVLLGLAGVAIIAAVVVAALRRKNKPGAEAEAPGTPHADGKAQIQRQIADGPEMQVHFVQSALPVITLHVTSAASGQSRAIEIPVNNTLFVGRSDICDVYFDDPQLSRQHFVIEEKDGLYTLTNLSTTGGTVLNGVPVQKPRPLSDGDIIEAGRERIVFYSRPAGKQ